MITTRLIKQTIVGLGAVALAVGGTACGGDDDVTTDDVETAITDAAADAEDVAEDALELAAQTAAAQLAAQNFAAAGHPISGQLSCTADAAGSLQSVDVNCTGTTEAGGQAELTGTMDQLPDEAVVAIDGQFTGTVDGEQVFETNRLGA
jgi:hypothetical protein